MLDVVFSVAVFCCKTCKILFVFVPNFQMSLSEERKAKEIERGQVQNIQEPTDRVFKNKECFTSD